MDIMTEQIPQNTPTEEQENQSGLKMITERLMRQAEASVKPRRWVYFVILVLVILLVFSGVSTWIVERQMQRLEAQIAIVESERARLSAELDKKTTQLMEMQLEHDAEIKEVPKNAYKKAIAVPDADMLNAVNELISGARKRNAEREQDSRND